MPFLAYVGFFLVLPSVIIGIGAFLNADNAFTLNNFRNLSRSYVFKATIDTTVISAITALLGASLGAILAYAIVTGSPNGLLRRLTVSVILRSAARYFLDGSRARNAVAWPAWRSAPGGP